MAISTGQVVLTPPQGYVLVVALPANAIGHFQASGGSVRIAYTSGPAPAAGTIGLLIFPADDILVVTAPAGGMSVYAMVPAQRAMIIFATNG